MRRAPLAKARFSRHSRGRAIRPRSSRLMTPGCQITRGSCSLCTAVFCGGWPVASERIPLARFGRCSPMTHRPPRSRTDHLFWFDHERGAGMTRASRRKTRGKPPDNPAHTPVLAAPRQLSPYRKDRPFGDSSVSPSVIETIQTPTSGQICKNSLSVSGRGQGRERAAEAGDLGVIRQQLIGAPSRANHAAGARR